MTRCHDCDQTVIKCRDQSVPCQAGLGPDRPPDPEGPLTPGHPPNGPGRVRPGPQTGPDPDPRNSQRPGQSRTHSHHLVVVAGGAGPGAVPGSLPFEPVSRVPAGVRFTPCKCGLGHAQTPPITGQTLPLPVTGNSLQGRVTGDDRSSNSPQPVSNCHRGHPVAVPR